MRKGNKTHKVLHTFYPASQISVFGCLMFIAIFFSIIIIIVFTILTTPDL